MSSAFKWAWAELGLVNGRQDWKVGAEAAHHRGAMQVPMIEVTEQAGLPLSAFVPRAEGEHMAFPVLGLPPHAPQRFGPRAGDIWTVRSKAQNRPLDRQVSYDPVTGTATRRSGWADMHVVDRIVNAGIARREGQLVGWVDQLVELMTISILGALIWWRRRPVGGLGVPPLGEPLPKGAVVALVVLGALLPLSGGSVVILILLDRLLFRHLVRDRR